MHLQSKATVIFVDSLKYLREEFDTVGGSSETRRSFFRWRGHELPNSNFSERLPTPPSLLAPGFNPIFALTTNPLASSCQSALPPVVSWFKVQFIVMSLCTCINEKKGVSCRWAREHSWVCFEGLHRTAEGCFCRHLAQPSSSAHLHKGSTIILVPKESNPACPRLLAMLDPLPFAHRADQSAVDAISKCDSGYKADKFELRSLLSIEVQSKSQ